MVTAESDTIRLLRARGSVREFSDEEVKEEELGKVLEAARGAPTAGNLQAWKVFVSAQKEGRQQLCSQEWLNEAPVVLVFCALPGRSGHKYGRRGRHLYALQDATIAAAHAQIAAEAVGLRSCFVGAFHEEEVLGALGATQDPDDPVPVLIMGMGRPSARAAVRKPRRRLPMAELVKMV